MIKNKVLTPVLAGVLGVSVIGSGVGYYLVNKDGGENSLKPEQTMDSMKLSLTQVEQTVNNSVQDAEKAVKGELDYAYDASFKITFGDGITANNSTLKQYAKPVQIDTKVKQKGQNSQADITAKYNDATLITLETIYARDKNAAYFRIPELSSSYITATEDDLKKAFEDYAKKAQTRTGTVNGGSALKTDSELNDKLSLKNLDVKAPELSAVDSEKLEKSLKEYFELFKSKLPAKKDNGTVSGDINGNAYNYKVVTYTITGKQMQDALNAVLDKMAGDADLKKMYDDQIAASKAKNAKSYADFIAELKKETAIKEQDANKNATFDVYYDGEELVGGAITYDGKSLVKAVIVNKDTVNAIDVSVADNNGKQLLTVKGSSKLTDGTISGSYAMDMSGTSAGFKGSLTLDKVVLKDDYFNGTIKLNVESTGKKTSSPLGNSFALILSGNCTKDNKDIKFSVETSGKNMMTVQFTMKKTEASDIAVPTSNIFTVDQLDKYKATCDIEGFKENLNTAFGTNIFSMFDIGNLDRSKVTNKSVKINGNTNGKTEIDMSDLYDMYSF